MAAESVPPGGVIPAPVNLPRLPADAERLGLSQWTAPELMFVSQLDARKRGHKLIAWAIILLFAAPTLLSVVVGIVH